MSEKVQNILVVDDDEDILTAGRLLLKRKFGRVQTTSDPEQIPALMAENSFDVILLDMGMPVMNGWEVARRLRADPAGKSLLIIAVTAHAMERDRLRCFEAGCDLFFSKPVNFRKLGETILEHCQSRRSS